MRCIGRSVFLVVEIFGFLHSVESLLPSGCVVSQRTFPYLATNRFYKIVKILSCRIDLGMSVVCVSTLF